MPNPLVDIEKAGLISLVEFARQAEMEQDDSVYSLRDEAITVKHTLTTFNHVVEKEIAEYNQILEAKRIADTSGADPEKVKKAKEKISKSEKSKLVTLLAVQDQMRTAVAEVAKIVKIAAEVEAIKSTRFDSLQLLQLLQQIPVLLTDILTEHLGKVFEQLVDDILIAEGEHPDNQFVNKTFEIREHAINELVLDITAKMSEQINELKVAYNRDTFGPQGDAATGQALAVDPAEIIRRQVGDMMNAVPSAPAAVDPREV